MALVLREKQVRSLLSMRDTVGVLQKAFNALAQEIALNQPRTRLRFANGTLNILAAIASTFGVLEEITLYKGVGIALEDIVTVAHVYNLACQEGMDEEIALLS